MRTEIGELFELVKKVHFLPSGSWKDVSQEDLDRINQLADSLNKSGMTDVQIEKSLDAMYATETANKALKRLTGGC